VTFGPAARDLLAAARRATLATITSTGRARLVPICFVAIDDVLWSPIDEKPKSTGDPLALARVRDIRARPEVTVLVDRWSEDWSELAWVRLEAHAEVIEAPAVPIGIIEALRQRYPQYREHDLEHRPMLRISIQRATSWFAADR
jgi:PPOX class probable F420-dependent enzyme